MLTWESTGLEEKEEARKWGSGLEQSGWEHFMTSSYIRDLSCKLSCQKKLCASWSQCNRLTEQSSWTSRSTTRATVLLRPGLCALVSVVFTLPRTDQQSCCFSSALHSITQHVLQSGAWLQLLSGLWHCWFLLAAVNCCNPCWCVGEWNA